MTCFSIPPPYTSKICLHLHAPLLELAAASSCTAQTCGRVILILLSTPIQQQLPLPLLHSWTKQLALIVGCRRSICCVRMLPAVPEGPVGCVLWGSAVLQCLNERLWQAVQPQLQPMLSRRPDTCDTPVLASVICCGWRLRVPEDHKHSNGVLSLGWCITWRLEFPVGLQSTDNAQQQRLT